MVLSTFEVQFVNSLSESLNLSREQGAIVAAAEAESAYFVDFDKALAVVNGVVGLHQTFSTKSTTDG